MRKLLLLASVLLIVVPFVAYLGRDLGWWSIVEGFDVSAHSSESMGLAITIYLFLTIVGARPSYLRIVLPVILIGGVWELSQLLLGFDYMTHYEAMKDLAV